MIVHIFCYVGEDYPLLAFPLDTTFICDDKISGYYADLEGECRQYHICASGLSFLYLCAPRSMLPFYMSLMVIPV